MLYGFLLSADPGALRSGVAGRALSGARARRRPGRPCRCRSALYQKLRPEVEALGLAELYETIDLPLVRVLARMEETGIRVDPDQLERAERAHGRGNRAAVRRDFRAGRQDVQYQFAATIGQSFV